MSDAPTFDEDVRLVRQPRDIGLDRDIDLPPEQEAALDRILARYDAANVRIKELEWACPCRNCAGCSDETKCTPWLTWDEHKTAAAREAVKR